MVGRGLQGPRGEHPVSDASQGLSVATNHRAQRYCPSNVKSFLWRNRAFESRSVAVGESLTETQCWEHSPQAVTEPNHTQACRTHHPPRPPSAPRSLWPAALAQHHALAQPQVPGPTSGPWPNLRSLAQHQVPGPTTQPGPKLTLIRCLQRQAGSSPRPFAAMNFEQL